MDTQTTVALTELQRLKTLLEEVEMALRSQREILKQRGMSLPPGALQNLGHLKEDLNQLEEHLTNETTELTQLRALAQTSALINSSLDLDVVLNEAMEVVINLTGAERGYIVLRDLETGELECRIARDLEQNGRGTPGFQGSNTILGDVLNSGEPLLTDNAYKDPRIQDNASIHQIMLRSVLCVPLKYKDQVTGALYVDNRLRTGVFTDRELNLLLAFANQAAVAIENARLFTRVQEILAEITEMKELMTNVFASIGSGVITTNAVNAITNFNRAAEQILGHPADTVIGQPLQTVLPRVGNAINEHLIAVVERGERQTVETELETPERNRVILSMKLSPLKDANRRTQGVAMVLDDLTEQRQREEMLEVMKRYLTPALLANITDIAQLAVGGVRREVTCLFADVRSLSTFEARLGAQERARMLNEYLSVATDAIHNASGVVDKYIGTEIMALFNTQLNPLENHAIQAVEAALTMRDAFIALYQQLGVNPEPHFYRVGIHSGVATLGNCGSLSRRDFTAIGATINQSKRLEENAAHGQIIVSEDTLRYIEAMGGMPNVVFEPRDPIQAKGIEEPIPIYEVFRT
jgi:PAS domain S-box-containing protein